MAYYLQNSNNMNFWVARILCTQINRYDIELRCSNFLMCNCNYPYWRCLMTYRTYSMHWRDVEGLSIAKVPFPPQLCCCKHKMLAAGCKVKALDERPYLFVTFRENTNHHHNRTIWNELPIELDIWKNKPSALMFTIYGKYPHNWTNPFINLISHYVFISLQCSAYR